MVFQRRDKYSVFGEIQIIILGEFPAARLSRKKFVELVVRADLNPFNRVAGAHAHGAILFVDANRPDVTAALKFFETQRRMIRVVGKELIRQPGTGLD
jgi:hypothetical protein